MTRIEANLLAEYAGVAFYIPDAQPGLMGDCVHLVRQGQSLKDEGELIGPHRFYTKWNAVEFRSLLNETYHLGLRRIIRGTFYAKSARVYFCSEGKFPDPDNDDRMLGRLYSQPEAVKAAEGLNQAFQLGAGGAPVLAEPLHDLLDRYVKDLELSIGSYHCLENASIITVRELVKNTEADLLQTKNFGRKSLNEIKACLHDLGLHLGMKAEV